MANSRSAMEFMERTGTHRMQTPRPRLAVNELLVNHVPLKHYQVSQGVLLGYEGNPSPDRGESRPWPTQQVIDGNVQ